MFKIAELKLIQTIGSQNIEIHPVIIFDDSDLILCDAGYPGQLSQINNELSKYGFSVNDLTKVVITHQDHDHIGSLSDLKKSNPKIKVITSKEELPFIEDPKKSLRLLQAKEYNKKLSGKALEFGIQFVNYLNTIQGCKIDQIVKDQDYLLPGLKVISTPGHMPGHISLFDETNQVFISGDALAVEDNKFVVANPEFTLDLDNCLKSISKINNLKPKKIICYHGGSIQDNVEKLLKDII